jgi:hypothetical protein
MRYVTLAGVKILDLYSPFWGVCGIYLWGVWCSFSERAEHFLGVGFGIERRLEQLAQQRARDT